MPVDESGLASVTDQSGREVVLLTRIWQDKIARDHPELAQYLEAVIETVAQPDHIEPDALPACLAWDLRSRSSSESFRVGA